MTLLIKALGLTDIILDSHVADPTGEYCVACSGNKMVKWPCSLRFYALEAKVLNGV